MTFEDGLNTDIVLLNKTISTEANLKELHTFFAYDDELGGKKVIDLQNLEDKPITALKKYANININSSLLENDILSNFNFKNLLSN